jgi:hypothetical protein
MNHKQSLKFENQLQRQNQNASNAVQVQYGVG